MSGTEISNDILKKADYVLLEVRGAFEDTKSFELAVAEVKKQNVLDILFRDVTRPLSSNSWVINNSPDNNPRSDLIIPELYNTAAFILHAILELRNSSSMVASDAANILLNYYSKTKIENPLPEATLQSSELVRLWRPDIVTNMVTMAYTSLILEEIGYPGITCELVKREIPKNKFQPEELKIIVADDQIQRIAQPWFRLLSIDTGRGINVEHKIDLFTNAISSLVTWRNVSPRYQYIMDVDHAEAILGCNPHVMAFVFNDEPLV